MTDAILQRHDDLDDAVDVYLGMRPRLVEIAYRVLGCRGEAEDVVQETWLRWQSTDRAVVRSPRAFLATTTTRLAINVALSARQRRETPVGDWTVEPIDRRDGPEAVAERDEAAVEGLHLLLGRLTPTERAAYLLREAFEYPHQQIADVLQLGVANTRQLVGRAQKRLASERRQPTDLVEHRRLVDAFRAASHVGDLGALEELLAAGIRTDRATRGFAAAKGAA